MTARLPPAILLSVLGLACAPAGSETVAIVGAKLYTMTGDAPVVDGTIIMRDGRIVAVGSRIAVPADARRIDGRDRVVTPALFNSATQLGLTEVSSVSATNDYAVSDGPLGAAFDVSHALNPNSLAVRQAAADGLGRAVSNPTSSASAPFSGFGMLLHLGGSDALEKPRLAMFAVVGGQSSNRAGGSRSAQWQLIRSALDESRTFRGGADPGGARDSTFNRLDLAALKEVTENRVPLVIDADRESDIREAVALARDYRVRVIVKGGLEAWRVAGELAAARVPVILDPSINLPLQFDELGARADNAVLLQRAGVLIAFTVSLPMHSTYNAGSALREVAGLAAANGLPEAAALAAITSNPAEIWGVADRAGTLAPGRDADLVLWDGDPLEPASLAVAVFLVGREVLPDTRQRALRDRYRPQSQALPPAYRN